MHESLRVRGLDAGIYHRSLTDSGWTGQAVPEADEIAAAAALVSSAAEATPLVQSLQLSERFGRSILLKLEMLSPVRSFKYRGALVAVDAIAKAGQSHSIVTASTGNHGQGVAFAGRRLGLDTVVVAPESAAQEKLDAMRGWGADVHVAGADLGEAQQVAESMAGDGITYLEDGESPELMAGAATVTTEILEACPTADSIVLPIGGGNLIAGALLANRLGGASGTTIIGVQSTAAPAVTMSWLDGTMRLADCSTFAGGLATTRPGKLALSVMVNDLETIALITDEDLRAAMAILMRSTGLQIEGASAAPIAALERFGDSLGGEQVVLVLTGNWCSQNELDDTIERVAAL
jgi:threonine dehydratase